MPLRTGVLFVLALGLALPVALSGSADGQTVHARKAKATRGSIVWPLAHPIGPGGRYPVRATFRPIRRGAVVRFQKLVSGTWHTVATTHENAQGIAKVNIEAGRAAAKAWRAVARAPKRRRMPALRITSSVVRPHVAAAPTWSDDFDGSSLDLDKWTYRQEGERIPNRACAVSDKRAVAVGGGVLQLKVIADPHPVDTPDNPKHCWNNKAGRNYYFLTGHVGAKQTFTRGTFSARIKFESGQNAHGAFWLQSSRLGTGGAEIDAVEYFGEGRGDSGIQQNIWSDPILHPRINGIPQGVQSSMANPALRQVFSDGKTPANGWHVYTVQWTRTEYVFRIDGVITFRTSKPYIATIPEQPILSLLTSDWEIAGNARVDASNPAKKWVMRVDWVKVWS